MKLLVVALCCLCLVAGQQERQRRRIKKKIIVQAEEPRVEEASERLQETDTQISDVANKPKEPRGFLDQYYKQFEDRTEKVQMDQMAQESVSRGFSQPQDNVQKDEVSSERRHDFADYDMETLLMREQQLQELLAREAELSPAQREELLRQLAAWPQPAPAAHKKDVLYQNSLQGLVDPTRNDVTLSSSDYQRFKKHSPSYSSDAGFFPNLLTSSLGNAVSEVEESADPDVVERDSGYSSYTRDTSYTSPGSANKFLGVTATTSQDIQLGLTFTVPFLSIPLNSINSLIGGNFGDIGNFLNFGNLDIGSLATIAVIGIAAIFVLPQAIYWLTGINLSSFNWGRSEDEMPGIVGLANTVDHALTEFNIDGKGCMAKSMCDILYGDDSEKHGMFVKAIANSASKNANMAAYLGDTKMKMLQEFGSIKEKYGAQPASCHNVFQSVCPWDSAGMSAIFMKLMASQGTSLAEMALKAAAAAS